MNEENPVTPGWNIEYGAPEPGAPEEDVPERDFSERGVPEPDGAARSGGGPGAAHRRVLVIADEWFPARGGLSSLNRYLCGAMAAAGAHVSCLVPAASPDEHADAEAAGVHLVAAPRPPGTTEREALMRKPSLPGGAAPDVVIGHGRVTGPIAQAMAEDHFPGSARFHFVHMAPDEIEWYKLDGENDAGLRARERSRLELDLARDAAAVAPVGPRLHAWLARDLPDGAGGRRARLVRLDPGFDMTGPGERRVRDGRPLVMIMGRMDDVHLKGVDLAAKAFGRARRLRAGSENWELLVRGAPPGAEGAFRSRLLGWIGDDAAHLTVRGYSSDAREVQEDLQRASLVLMPSRKEGYGLVGHEAITAGTPALVSADSGLAELVRTLAPGHADDLVVPMRHRPKQDAELWGHRIAAVLGDREAAFARAAKARAALAERANWAMAVDRLFAAP